MVAYKENCRGGSHVYYIFLLFISQVRRFRCCSQIQHKFAFLYRAQKMTVWINFSSNTVIRAFAFVSIRIFIPNRFQYPTFLFSCTCIIETLLLLIIVGHGDVLSYLRDHVQKNQTWQPGQSHRVCSNLVQMYYIISKSALYSCFRKAYIYF